jgi:hypothetical protein
VNVHAIRNTSDRIAQLFLARLGDARLTTAIIIQRQAEARPLTFEPVGLVGFQRLAGLEGAVEEILEFLDLRVDFSGRQQAL